MKIPVGETVKKTMFVHVEKYKDRPTKDNPNPHNTVLFSCDMSDSGYALLGEVAIEYTIPNVDPIEKAVQAIDAQIQKEMAESEHRLNILREKKSQLLAITYQLECEQC